MEAGGEEGQSKGETLAPVFRFQLRATVLNRDQHPTPLLPLGGLLAICLGPPGAGGVPTEDGGNNPSDGAQDGGFCLPVPTLLAERW